MFVRQWEGLKCEALEWLMYDRGLERESPTPDGPASQLTDESAAPRAVAPLPPPDAGLRSARACPPIIDHDLRARVEAF